MTGILNLIIELCSEPLFSGVCVESFNISNDVQEPEQALRDAINEFINSNTEESKQALEFSCGDFNWGDAMSSVPDSYFEKHGLTRLKQNAVDVVVNHDEVLCGDYNARKEASELMEDLMEQENELFRSYGGHIPEANEALNNLQREKIAAVYKSSGKAYIGKVNVYDDNRKNLTADVVFVEYTGQKVCNFGADFVVPVADKSLAEMIVQWNTGGLPTSINLIGKITNRVSEVGGVNLIWR